MDEKFSSKLQKKKMEAMKCVGHDPKCAVLAEAV
jgi:hypothetical protein